MKINWHDASEKPTEDKSVLAEISMATPVDVLRQYAVLKFYDDWVLGFSGEVIEEYGWEAVKWTYLD